RVCERKKEGPTSHNRPRIAIAPDSAGHVIAFSGDALRLQVKCFIQASDETGGDRRRPLCGSGDRLSPHTVLKLGTAFARRCELIRKLPLTMRLDPKRNILAQQLAHVCSVWLR